MKTKNWLLVVLVASVAALPLCGQNFQPKGDDNVGSFGKFWILIDPPYWPQFATCPAPYYDPATHVLQSPTLYEQFTTIGRSKSIKEGTPADNAGVPVGNANVPVRDAGMVLPSGFTPIAPGSNEVHTELHKLNMVTFGGGPMARVRAGMCYNSTACSSAPPPNRISRGEVVSNNATPGAPPDFPARSYFDVFAQIDIPACGGFPGATVFNSKPLLVHAPSIPNFPPSGVVYMHDASSAVGVKFVTSGKHGKKNERLGCVILAGHGIIPTFHRAELESTPSAVPVALQQPERAEKMRPQPNKEEVEREARRFEEHMRDEHEREGGRHKDCGPKEKDEKDND